MNQVLSQSEVDALLAAVSEGEASGGEASASGGGASGGGGSKGGASRTADDKVVVTYDLTSQDRIIRGRLPQLEVINTFGCIRGIAWISTCVIGHTRKAYAI